MPVTTLVLTIAPGGSILVSLRNADGTIGPSREVPLDQGGRLAAFVTAMQALAGQQLAPVEAAAEGRAGDGDPAITVEAVHGEHGR